MIDLLEDGLKYCDKILVLKGYILIYQIKSYKY
jgi:hypothetical protein